MKLFDYIDRLKIIHKLVEEQKTGSPEEFAKRLGIKRSTLYFIFEELKSKGISIVYSRQIRSFYYEYPINFSIGYSIEVIKKDEIKTKDRECQNHNDISINTKRR